MLTWFSNLASGWKAAIYMTLVLAIISAAGGTVVYIAHLGKAECEAKASASAITILQDDISRALTIGDEFVKIGQQLATSQAAAQQASAQRQFEIAQVIHDHPLPLACQLDPDLVRMRCESIAALYQAAGRAVPGSCTGAPEAARPAAAKR